jgi:hypothetical protein
MRTRANWLLALCALCGVGCVDGSRVQVRTDLDAPLTDVTVVFTFNQAHSSWEWRAVAAPSEPRFVRASPEFETRTGGELFLSIAIEHPTDGTIATGAITVPLRPDWLWGVSVRNATSNPAEYCFGCWGSTAVALPPAYRTAGRDSVWIVWGGNSITNPVTY